MVFRKLFKNRGPAEDQIRHPELKSDQVDGAHDESNWLVSYADMMTLLCGFFIMMFSMASLDKTKFDQVREEVSEYFNGKYESPANPLKESLTKVINEMGLQDVAKVTADYNGVAVSFQSVLFFETLSANIQNDGLKIIGQVIAAIEESQKRENKQYKIAVEGHSDSRPVLGGNYPSNWELSAARAARVVRIFIEKNFDQKRLFALGFADTRPEAESRRPSGEWDEASLAKNRRVIIRVLDPDTKSLPIGP